MHFLPALPLQNISLDPNLWLSGRRQLFFLEKPVEVWVGHKGVFVLELELMAARALTRARSAPRAASQECRCLPRGWLGSLSKQISACQLGTYCSLCEALHHGLNSSSCAQPLWIREREREKYSFQPSAMSKKPLVTVWEHCLNAGVQKGKEVKKKEWDFYHLSLYF